MSRRHTENFEGQHFVFLIGSITQLGGAERQAVILASMLRERVGARVSFLGWTMKDGLMPDLLREKEIPVFIHPLDWQHRLTWRKSRLAKAARLVGFTRYVRRTVRPDYLLPYVGVNSKVAALIWKRVGAKYSWWNQRDEGREIYGSRFDKWALRTLPDVVSNSYAGKEFLVEKCDVSPERIRVINNAVILPAPAPGSAWRTRLGLEDSDKLVLMVANLTVYKDHPTLLRAFARLRDNSNESARYHLAIAGRPEETEIQLKALAFELGLGESVRFVGPVADINSLYAAADLVVHSSVHEGCPNAVLEAMANARCVVGTDISGMRQALGDDDESVFAAPHDAEALAVTMQKFLESDELRRDTGERNRRRIEKEFSPNRLLEAVLSGIATHSIKR